MRKRFGGFGITGQFLAVILGLFPLIPAQATDKHWLGGTTQWSTNSNWSPSGKPAGNDVAVFDGTFSNQPILTGNESPGGIWMTGAVGQNVRITSEANEVLTLQDTTINGIASMGILVDNTSNAFRLTIRTAIKLGDGQDWINNTGNVVAIGDDITSVTAGTFGLDLNKKALTIGGTGDFFIFSIIQNSNITAGNGAIFVTGSGTRTFVGASTYDGLTTVGGGVLNIRNNTGLGTVATGTHVNAGGELQFQQTLTGADLTVGEDLTLNGSGTAGGGALRNINGNNTHSGFITLASNSTIKSDSGTLTLTGGIVNGGFTTTLGGVGNITEAGVISGSGGLVKTDSGTVRLTAINTMTGATTVNGGTLILAGGAGGALGATSSITVNAGGAVLLGASNEIRDAAPMVLAGGTFAKGDFSEGTTTAPGIGALTLTAAGSQIDFGTGTVGMLSFASFTPSGNVLTIDNWTGTPGVVGDSGTDRLIFNADQAANLNAFFFTGYLGATEINLGGGFYEVVPTAIPEPSTWTAGVLVFGTLVYGGFRRRQRRAARLTQISPLGTRRSKI